MGPDSPGEMLIALAMGPMGYAGTAGTVLVGGGVSGMCFMPLGEAQWHVRVLASE